MHLYHCARLCSLPNVVSGFPSRAKDEFFQNSHCYPSAMCKCLKITAYSAVSTQGTWKAGRNFFHFMHLCSHFYCHFCALCEEIERRMEMLGRGRLGIPWCFHGPKPSLMGGWKLTLGSHMRHQSSQRQEHSHAQFFSRDFVILH